MTKKSKKKIKVVTKLQRQWNAIKKVYPSCTGTYPDCPAEILDQSAPPAQCRVCPIYLQE